MTSLESMKTKPLALRLLGGAALTGLLVSVSLPAHAEQVDISGSQYVGIKVYPTAYHDTWPQNDEEIIIDHTNGGGGPPAYAGIARSTTASSFATTGEIYRQWDVFRNKSGDDYNPPGTFYLKIELDGGCGGNCIPINWSGRLSYNNKNTN